MTGIADTRLLLTIEFPLDMKTKKQVEDATTRELAHHLLAPSIVLTEYLKIAGARIGEGAARLRLKLLKDRGLRVMEVNEEMALSAGSLLLKHPDTPIADAIIASPVKMARADYVVTDDPHYKGLGVRTKWL